MICATLGLCSGLEDNWSPYGVKATNNTACSDCTKFFTDVQHSITSKETLVCIFMSFFKCVGGRGGEGWLDLPLSIASVCLFENLKILS